MNVIELLEKSLSFKDDTSLKNILNQKLSKSNISRTQFEKLSKIERKSLDSILNNTSKQTDVIKLLKISQFLDINIEQMLILFLKDRPKSEIKDLKEAIDLAFLQKHFDIKSLTDIGLLNSNDDLSTIIKKLCYFFNLDSIYDFEIELNEALYSRTKRTFSDKMKDFWIKSSYKYFEIIGNPNEFSRKELVNLIPKIRPYTLDIDEGLLTVFRALYNIGVTVIYQPSLPKTQIRGATFIVKDKPCIVITDLNKNYATIWFALIHELHHVLYDMETIERTSYHLTGEPDLFLIQEDKANNFAKEYLFSEDKLRNIEPFIHNDYVVTQRSKEYQIHPSIIYSIFQHWKHEQGENYWGAFKRYFPDTKKATRHLGFSNWSESSIKDSAERIKEILTV